MPRQLRIQYAGAQYHVIARGNRGEAIFFGDEDRKLWVETLGEASERTGWEVHAWVLMNNHYHLVLQTPEANLVAGMQWLQTTFALRMNARHGLSGNLFGGRYKTVLVQAEKTRSGQEQRSHPFGYLGTVMDYVHLNPARAGILSKGKKKTLDEYRWSSLAAGYVQMPGKRPRWLDAKTGLAVFGLKDTAHGRRKFLERLEERIHEEGSDSGKAVVEGQSLQTTLLRGWYFGNLRFREKMLTLLPKKGKLKNKRHKAAEIVKDHSGVQAEKIIHEFLGKNRLKENDFLMLSPAHVRKAELATKLHRQTTVKLQWIAERLEMKSESNVSHIIRRHKLSKFKA
ncbi:MAG: transposase [Chthoniobacterales bacterium]